MTSWFHAIFSNELTTPQWKSLDYLVIMCETELVCAEYLTSLDPIGHITIIEQNGALATDVMQYLGPNATEGAIISSLNKLMNFASSSSESLRHNDSFACENSNYVLKALVNGTNTNPLTPVPQASLIAPIVGQLHTTICAILLALTPAAFETMPNHAKRVPGNVYSDQHRIFMGPVMTIMALSILTLTVIVAAILDTRRPGR